MIAEDIDSPDNPSGSGEEKETNFSHDTFWKDLIERFFYPLLKRAIPELYKRADTAKKPRFLDKEFRDVLNTRDRKILKSPHYADFIIEVPLKGGGAEWVLFHIEAQHGPGGGNMAKRMRHYNSLIYAHFQREPVALAIITGAKGASLRTLPFWHGNRLPL